MYWRGSFIFLAVVGGLLALAAPAAAHPMGNFSISHYARIRVQRDGVLFRYRLDYAEIPSVEEMKQLNGGVGTAFTADQRQAYLVRKTAELTGQLHLAINGHAVVLEPVKSEVEIRPGAGNLPNVLLNLDYRAAPTGWEERNAVDYTDGNFPGRIGWRETVVTAGDGCWLVAATAPDAQRTKALTIYPAEGPTTPQDSGAKLTELAMRANLSTGLILAALATAFGLGCFHALAPGHGKTVVAAYLVGSRGTPAHACLLGTVVTLTHTIGVFALGVIVLFASQYILPETLYPWLGFISGMTIAAIGGWQLMRRYAAAYRPRYVPVAAEDGAGSFVLAPGTSLHAHDGHVHSHDHGAPGHVHGPGGHTHDMPEHITARSLIALGVSGGMVPCPSALVLLLSAIAFHRVGLGLLLTTAFSFGLASVLIAIGLLMLYARRLMEKLPWRSRATRLLPMASSVVVALLGVGIALAALATRPQDTGAKFTFIVANTPAQN